MTSNVNNEILGPIMYENARKPPKKSLRSIMLRGQNAKEKSKKEDMKKIREDMNKNSVSFRLNTCRISSKRWREKANGLRINCRRKWKKKKLQRKQRASQNKSKNRR